MNLNNQKCNYSLCQNLLFRRFYEKFIHNSLSNPANIRKYNAKEKSAFCFVEAMNTMDT